MLFKPQEYLSFPDGDLNKKSRKKVTEHPNPHNKIVLVKYETHTTHKKGKQRKYISSEDIDLSDGLLKEDLLDNKKVHEYVEGIYHRWNETVNNNPGVGRATRKVISIHRIEFVVKLTEIQTK